VRRPVLAVTALLAASACNCGDDPSTKPDPRLGAACTKQADCGSSLLCFAGTCEEALPASAACATPGASPELLAGAAVVADDPGVGVCAVGVQAPVFPAGAGLGQVQDLGVHTVGDVVTFTVPTGTWSVTVYEQAVGAVPASVTLQSGSTLPNVAVPDDVKLPGGTVLFDDTPASIPPDADGFDDYTGLLAVHFGAPTPYTGTATWPNATKGLELARVAGELPPGTWSMTVNDYAYECATTYAGSCTGGGTTQQYRVHVLTKGPPRGTGRLDLDVYLASARFTAQTAASSAAMQRVFDGAALKLGNAGICLGTVTFHDLPAWARTRFEQTDYDETKACDGVAQLFRLSQTQSANVHYFLVDEILAVQPGAPGTQLLGLDGAIPGPSGLPGSPSSGAVASLGTVSPCSGAFDLERCEADQLGYVTAHEIGHWLGLFHTTEAPGIFFDPLADTGRCPCPRCARSADRPRCGSDPDLYVTTSQCTASATCAGGDNLMFWIISGNASKGRVSTQQGEVARANPAVKVTP